MAKTHPRKNSELNSLIKSPKEVEDLLIQAQTDLSSALDQKQVEIIRLKYLGRKGILPLALRGIKDLTDEQKHLVGPALNSARQVLAGKITQRLTELAKEDFEQIVAQEKIDVSEPVAPRPIGHLHPTEYMRREIEDIFRSMGFEVVRGQEIDNEENNFDLLNIPADHPARDMWDTFWLKLPEKFGNTESNSKKSLLLRTHTSNMQVRTMRERKPPLHVVNIGRVYRFEATDKTHENTFHQVEGFIVDEKTNLGDLRGIFQAFFETLFGQKLKTRLRPSYFPFTEPSVELDISCTFCKGKGCGVCKYSGWLELLGAGMIHPNVLKNGGFNPVKYQGFAFGIGLDRLTMMKYRIDDIRLLLSGDLRFLEQF